MTGYETRLALDLERRDARRDAERDIDEARDEFMTAARMLLAMHTDAVSPSAPEWRQALDAAARWYERLCTTEAAAREIGVEP